jgi:predicted component of type VI protein secretion system
MPAQLRALSDGPNLILDKPIMVLGRHPECDIQLNSRKVSRRHCCIAQVQDYLIVRDLGSTNGIRINGSRVLEGKLKPGDELTIGNFRYQISLEDGSPPPIPKNHGKMTAQPVSGKPILDDDELEELEEPVALEESEPPIQPFGHPGRPQQPPQGGLGGTLKDSNAHLLPEHLTLIPPSGAFPKPNPNE